MLRLEARNRLLHLYNRHNICLLSSLKWIYSLRVVPYRNRHSRHRTPRRRSSRSRTNRRDQIANTVGAVNKPSSRAIFNISPILTPLTWHTTTGRIGILVIATGPNPKPSFTLPRWLLVLLTMLGLPVFVIASIHAHSLL